MKTKVEIDLTQEQIDVLVGDELRNLEKENKRLQKRIGELEQTIRDNYEKSDLANKIYKVIEDSDLFHKSDGCYGDNC